MLSARSRSKVESDLDRRAKRHVGSRVDVEATSLAAGAARAAQRGVDNDQRGIDRGGVPRQHRNAAAQAVATVGLGPSVTPTATLPIQGCCRSDAEAQCRAKIVRAK